jgi:hypothetical protein
MMSGRSASASSRAAASTSSASGAGRRMVQSRSAKNSAGQSYACDWMSCGSEITTAPVSTGSVSTRIAVGSAVSNCSGRVMRSKNRDTGRNTSLTDVSASLGCWSCCSTGPWRWVAYESPGSNSTGRRFTVARPAPVTMLSAPGPIEAVTASVACRRDALAYPDAMCTSACSLRPCTNGIASLSWSNAWPRPATLPWPKMPSVAGTNLRRRPSATEYCLDRYVTTAWATVSFMSGSPYQGRPCSTMVFSSVISATARRGPSLPMPLPFSPP